MGFFWLSKKLASHVTTGAHPILILEYLLIWLFIHLSASTLLFTLTTAPENLKNSVNPNENMCCAASGGGVQVCRWEWNERLTGGFGAAVLALILEQ